MEYQVYIAKSVLVGQYGKEEEAKAKADSYNIVLAEVYQGGKVVYNNDHVRGDW